VLGEERPPTLIFGGCCGTTQHPTAVQMRVVLTRRCHTHTNPTTHQPAPKQPPTTTPPRRTSICTIRLVLVASTAPTMRLMRPISAPSPVATTTPRPCPEETEVAEKARQRRSPW
jgi:hypothetical protein